MTMESDFFTAFLGTHKACGLVLGPFGKITKEFTGTLLAEIKGTDFVLHESFVFNDGELYQRDWLIQRKNQRSYTATAQDVIGVATATVTGNTIVWDYPQRLMIGKKGFVVNITDYMLFMPDGVTLGYTKMRKFGLPVGKIITTFQRQSMPV